MFANYFKIAIKVLLRRKFYTFISLFGISLTIMFITVGAAFLQNVFGTRPPEKKLDRTLSVTFMKINTKHNGVVMGPMLSYYFLNKYVKSLKTPEMVSIVSTFTTVSSYRKNRRIDMALKYCDSEFWQILEFDFIEGHGFTKEDVENKNPVAVINRSIREQYFDDENALGKTIEADGVNYTVIGVVENVPLLRLLPYSDLWVPVSMSKADLNKPSTVSGIPSYQAMVLAKSPADFRRIKDEYHNALAKVEFPEPDYLKIDSDVDTYGQAAARQLTQAKEGESRIFIIIFSIFAVLFMTLPAINLINLNTSRIMERASEIAIRKAFGASKRTLLVQFLFENMILTIIGGVISLAISFIVLQIINNSGLIRYCHLTMDWTVFGITILTILFFGLFSGLYPSWKMAKAEVVQALKEFD